MTQDKMIELTPDQEAAFIRTASMLTQLEEMKVESATLRTATSELNASIEAQGVRLAEITTAIDGTLTEKDIRNLAESVAKTVAANTIIEQLASVGYSPATAAPVNQSH